MDNVILSPHNSNSSPKAWEGVHINTINNLIEGLNNFLCIIKIWENLFHISLK